MEFVQLGASKIRRQWLRSWKAMVGYKLLEGSIFLALMLVVGEWTEDEALRAAQVLWGLLLLLLCRVYAYEQHGVIFLRVILIIAGWGVMRGFPRLAQLGYDPCDVVEHMINVGLFIWFASTSNDLLSLNKKRKKTSKTTVSIAESSTETS